MNPSSSAPPWLCVDDAVRCVLANASPLPTEPVPLALALGRVAAHDVLAPWDLPMGHVSIMDGYAARSVDLLSSPHPRLRVVGESAAGHRYALALQSGEAVRISTGAWLPDGSDLVVPQEDTQRLGDDVHIDHDRYGEVRAGRWVRARGSDVPKGHRVVAAGVRMAATDLASAAAAGLTSIVVHRKPRVALVSTGDELVPLGQAPEPGQIVNSNALMLRLLAEQAGAEVCDLGIVRDDPRALAEVLEQAAPYDILVSSGGISVGEHDHVAGVLRNLGWRFEFERVAMRPGKPTAFARRGPCFAMALPGNPASSLVGFWLFVRPLVRRLSAVGGDPVMPRLRVRLRTPVEGAGRRTHFVRAQLHDDGSASPLAEQASGHLSSMVDVDALLEVPPGTDGLPAESWVNARVMEPWWNERRPRAAR